jgi:hypothetical protein
MRRALDAIGSGLGESDDHFLAHGAFEIFGALGQHALDGLGIMALVGGQEGHGVSRRDLRQGRLEHHDAIGTLIEHLHLEVGGESWRGSQCDNRDCGQNLKGLHFELLIGDRISTPLSPW